MRNTDIDHLFSLVFQGLDFVGRVVFALSGARVAAHARQTPLTFVCYAVIVGVGGSTVSELLIGVPVTWVHNPTAIIECLVVAAVTWTTPLDWWTPRVIVWLEAVGVSAYAIVGSAKALSLGLPSVSAALTGVITACVGGVIRDVLAGRPSVIVNSEIFMTAAACAAVAYVALVALGLPAPLAAALAFAAGFGLRAIAITRNLSLPIYRRG
jgi:uncharacterized membrane protein YeiH